MGFLTLNQEKTDNTVYVGYINPLYTGGLFHRYMLDESICHFRGVGSILSMFLFLIENTVSKLCRPWSDASELGLHCLPMTL